MLDALLEIALDLSKNLSETDRYQRLLASVSKVVDCDASALLKYEAGLLTPLAINGLSQNILGKPFDPVEHPRFARILASNQPTRFPSNSPLPDPYDGYIEGVEGKLEVHACMGCTLRVDNQIIGILTLDGLTPSMFDKVDDQTMATFSVMAAATLQAVLLIENLENKATNKTQLAQDLVKEALKKDGGELIGQSYVINQLKQEINVVAQSDLTVLVLGQTGVGKELVARTIHSQSNRDDQPLVYINCAALPESIAESELFGHSKGAFTGAIKERGGKFELANGGTLFLDEIGELSLNIQAKMLRALQSGEIQKVGADKTKIVDVRIVAATNRNLKDEVIAGRFRADLYHRLTVYPIQVPPLAEREGDIALLAEYFLDQLRKKLGLSHLNIQTSVLTLLEDYTWPGNVRELEHVLSRAALRARAAQAGQLQVIIEPHHCDIKHTNKESTASPKQQVVDKINMSDAINQFQLQLISERLKYQKGNWSQTASSLSLDRGNLHRLSKRLGLK